MRDYDIVIIDSGINQNIYNDVPGICVSKSEEGFYYSKDIDDEVGHGTIIYSVIQKQAPSTKIFMIKLDERPEAFDSSILIEALQYVKMNIRCKWINMSLGVKICDQISKLYSICSDLTKMGSVIVSAFDNEGCYSYPAAFDCIIGVDTKNDLKSATEYDYIQDSPINIFAKGSVQRQSLKDGKTLLVGGSSISCAHIVAKLANGMTGKVSLSNALEYLKKNARQIYLSQHTEDNSINKIFEIQKAIVFPFAKEAHAFVRYSDMIPFQIQGYYDIRRSGKVGKTLSSYYEGFSSDETIKDIDRANFEGIDTIILGHLDELNSISQRDYRDELIQIAIEKHLNIYSFDSLNQYAEKLYSSGIQFFSPHINSNNVPSNTFGKLYKISKPVVGIFGTSSQQGKFSLQLALKRGLEAKDYNVGTIGTEPHSLLIDFDVVFPMGYHSTVNLQNQEVVTYLNNAINHLCTLDKEIILTSSQAQTIPYYCNHLLEFPSLQYHFALGINPDAIMLCINYFDEIEYIKNTVNMLQGLTNSSILSLVMNPMTYTNEWSTVKRKISSEEFSGKAESLWNELSIPVYLLGEESVSELCQNIIDFF